MNWCLQTVVLEKTLESLLDYQEIKPVNPKGNQSWIFIGKIDTEAETPNLWPHDAKDWLTGKDPDAGKDWRQKEKGTTDNEITDSMDMIFNNSRRWWRTGKPGMFSLWGHKPHDWATEQPQNDKIII